MKNIKYIFSLLMITFLFSCDDVEGPYIEGTPFDCNYVSELPIRKILIEDFTGWNCPNCPSAAVIIESISERYPCHIIPIAVHAGGFAYYSGGPDFTTDIGYEIGGDGSAADATGFFNVIGQPVGVMNRIMWEEGEYKLERQVWEDNMVSLLEQNKFSTIGIEIENDFDAGSRELNTTVKTTTFGEINHPMSLVVYILESHIIGKQKNGSETIENYEHNHVLRGGFNGTWGESISTSLSVSTDIEFENTYSMTLDTAWVPENCHVVAFISNTETLEVIQVEEHHVISE